MSEVNNRLTDVMTVDEPKVKKTKLSEEQGVAVHLLQEREEHSQTILEMNDLLKEVDRLNTANAVLRRQLYQFRLNSITKENDELRKQYKLPIGNATYEIEDGDIYLVENTAK